MKRKILVVFLVLVILSSIFIGCSNANDTMNEDTQTATQKQDTSASDSTSASAPSEASFYPIVKDKITLKAMGASYTGHAPWGDLAIFKKLEEVSNIKLEFNTFDGAVYREKLTLALTSGDLPDFFINGNLTSDIVELYGPQGVLIPLQDLVEEHAPVTKEFLETEIDAKKDCTSLDGNIYTLPNVTRTVTSAGMKIYINDVWRKQFNMEIPKTVDDLYDYLKAVKENDPNGNSKADEIPISYFKDLTVFDNCILPAYGTIMNSEYIGVKGDKAIFAPFEEGYKEYLQYLNRLYSEKLLDNDIFSQTNDQFTAKGKNELFGVLTQAYSILVPADKYNNYEIIQPMTSSLNSKQICPSYQSVNPTCFAITSTNKYPVETIKLIDVFYRDPRDSYEGLSGSSIWLGLLDTHWRYTNPEQTKYEFTLDLSDGLTLVEHLHKKVCLGWGLGNMIMMAVPDNDPWNEKVANENTTGYYPFMQPIFPSNARYLPDESERLSILSTDISTYANQMAAKFVVGEESFDNWDNYLNELKKIGADEFLEIKQAAFDRYNGKK